MNDRRDLTIVLKSRFPLVVVETHEEARVLALLERIANLALAAGRTVPAA